MINKDEIKKLINEKNFEEVLEIFSKEYLDCLKMVLEKNNIKYEQDISLIDAIMLVDINIPNSELITHTPMETIFMETREIESRVNYALNWYDKWIQNLQIILNKSL